jgi:hypothetical protein
MGRPKNHKECIDVVIDSKDRNHAIYPNPADYVIPLPFVVRGVKHIELMSLQITRTEPTVHSGNNQFLYTVGGQSYTITVPTQDYQFGEQDCLVRALKKAMRQVSPTIQISRTDQMRLLLTDTQPFSLSLNEPTAKLFGLPWTADADVIHTLVAENIDGVYQIRGTRAMDLTGAPYIILYINDYNRITSPSNMLNRAYMIIPMESRRYMDRFIISNDEKEKKSKFKLSDQQRSIHQFRVRFTRPDGTLYDFNGMDHHLVFKLS